MGRPRRLKALGVFEVDTGAILSGVRLELSKERGASNPFNGRWHKMASKGWLRLAEARLSPSSSRVLYVMFYLMKEGNRIRATQEALAKDAGMFQPDVSAAIKDLVDSDIIQRGGERGLYLLNPQIGFIGDSEQHQEAVSIWNQSHKPIASIQSQDREPLQA
jgi:hypothetical protein